MSLEPLIDGIEGFAYEGVRGGGCVVLRREAYEQCPLDMRFKGWGQEDESWAIALRCIYGQCARLGAPLWHLWHTPQDTNNRRGSSDNLAIYDHYVRARRKPDKMLDLIAEGRNALVG